MPFNFQVGEDVKKVPLYPPTTAEGELEVRVDSCDGERIAVLPLAPAARAIGVTLAARVAVTRPRAQRHRAPRSLSALHTPQCRSHLGHRVGAALRVGAQWPTSYCVAPMQGWSAPLDEVPDAVFAARLLGDGVAIDPTGATLHAPCDGEIVTIPAQKHAVTLRAANGAEILLHVGIDTVALGGEGFELQVREGTRVKAGDVLMRFDLDLLAQRAKSLLTPIIVTDARRSP